MRQGSNWQGRVLAVTQVLTHDQIGEDDKLSRFTSFLRGDHNSFFTPRIEPSRDQIGEEDKFSRFTSFLQADNSFFTQLWWCRVGSVHEVWVRFVFLGWSGTFIIRYSSLYVKYWYAEKKMEKQLIWRSLFSFSRLSLFFRAIWTKKKEILFRERLNNFYIIFIVIFGRWIIFKKIYKTEGLIFCLY